MNKPGPKPREDRRTVCEHLKAIRWSLNELDAIEDAREDGESFSAVVKRLVKEGLR